MDKTTHTGEKRFKCDVCWKGFSQASALVTHKRCHTGEKPFKCDVCDKGFAQSVNLKTHQRIHTGEKPFKCDVCGKAFAVSGNLKRHQSIHTRDKTKRARSQVARGFECKECNMKFSSPRVFDEHLLNHELEATEPTGMEYICAHCDETFDFTKMLRDHVNETHIYR